MFDELLDIVDINDCVIGQKYRSQVYQLGLNNFRAINAFLINEHNHVWIPRRQPTKERFPLCLDASVGGHVGAGEEYEQAFVRELHEELNMHAHEVGYTFIGKMTPHEHNVSAFMHVYIMKTSDTPNYNSDDFIEASWYTIPDVLDVIRDGERAKSDLATLLNFVYNTVINKRS